MSVSVHSPTTTGLEVAIVGMAGRFPGAGSTGKFWENLREGVESISFFTPEELEAAGVEPATIANPRYVKAHGVLEGAELFDAAFFGFTPREAEVTDPQQRLFLECAWEALEHAGHDPARFSGRVGVYAGVNTSSYLLHNLLSNPELLKSASQSQIGFGNEKDFIATRVSYKLNLEGPGVTVQAACSTSLVAVHLACQALLSGDCDMALSGGVSVVARQRAGYLYQEGGILSPDGHCRAFDARAGGTVRGNGMGVVVLKRLEDALADGDAIYAVIKGSAINNDGSEKIGFTAPRVDGQAGVIQAAQATAEVGPETVTYVEAHGTGTELGDPIEVAALTQAFRRGTERRGYCALGSVKSNVGHLDTAAGVTGLIKTVLALHHREIPPSLHFERPNPALGLEGSPFYVNTRLRAWERGDAPRRAGVSSFGIGGTNVHVVLEEAPPRAPSPADAGAWRLLVLSARTEEALEEATDRLAGHLEAHPGEALADVAYTLQVGRRAFEHRRALVCRDHAEAIRMLRERETVPPHGAGAGTAGRMAFLFPGQGAQYVGMGRGLYEGEPVFRAEVDRCAEILRPHLGLDIREVVYPSPEREAQAAEQLKQTALTQPALFAVEYALARQWMAWGFEPAAMLGHSVGEYVAATLAGVFSLEDALALVAARGRLMQRMPGGAMLAVSLPEAEVRPLLDEALSVAAVNAPGSCVVAGPHEAVEALERDLAARGVEGKRLQTSHAFHSAMMEPILEAFAAEVARTRLHPPQRPFVSNLSGGWIGPEEAQDPAYWTRHLREAVRFADGVRTLADDGHLFLEVGPGRTLSSLARRQARGCTAVASMRHAGREAEDGQVVLEAVGQLWVAGVKVEWERLCAGGRRVPLPTYPFQRSRFWVDAPATTAGDSAPAVGQGAGPAQVQLYPGAVVHRRPAAPADGREARVAEIWSAILGVGEIGPQDDFFALGGDSLLATQVVARICEAFQVELPLQALFEAPTVARLAQRIAELETEGLADMLADVEGLSDEEIELLMAGEEVGPGDGWNS